ncbi:hypothetical protein [Roseiflexus sp.]|uniref:hypothetical protein n=1 Tax=Roseiflexus sp. TaxID=2562120 RepID=UPI00258F1AD6|nr:hypothetical protein [Roseiflexus sp.]
MLLAMSVLPFRGVYDLVALWLIPRLSRHAFVLTALSWTVPLFDFGVGLQTRPAWSVPVLCPSPALGCILYDGWQARRKNAHSHAQ